MSAVENPIAKQGAALQVLAHVNTCHITEASEDFLTGSIADENPIAIRPVGMGVLLNVPHIGYLDLLSQLPVDVRKIVEWANEAGAEWLLFDSDATPHDDLDLAAGRSE
jgi:hypothetical protein